MQSIGSITRPIAIAKANENPIAIDDKEIDYNLELYRHLVSPEWKAWHAKWIKRHGMQEWVKNAKIAEQDGKDKPKYFSFLLRKAQ